MYYYGCLTRYHYFRFSTRLQSINQVVLHLSCRTSFGRYLIGLQVIKLYWQLEIVKSTKMYLFLVLRDLLSPIYLRSLYIYVRMMG